MDYNYGLWTINMLVIMYMVLDECGIYLYVCTCCIEVKYSFRICVWMCRGPNTGVPNEMELITIERWYSRSDKNATALLARTTE